MAGLFPPLGLGTAPLGGLYSPVSDEQAHEVIGAAWDRGIRFFDTAPLYGHGASERRLGAVLRGKPRGLRWSDVAFDDDVVYARDRKTGGLKALVAIEVSFEAVEGGGMEHVEAVANVRAATAEFLHDGTRWRTEGRVYFNLAPTATVKYLAADLEIVAEEHAVRA